MLQVGIQKRNKRWRTSLANTDFNFDFGFSAMDADELEVVQAAKDEVKLVPEPVTVVLPFTMAKLPDTLAAGTL